MAVIWTLGKAALERDYRVKLHYRSPYYLHNDAHPDFNRCGVHCTCTFRIELPCDSFLSLLLLYIRSRLARSSLILPNYSPTTCPEHNFHPNPILRLIASSHTIPWEYCVTAITGRF